jgi:hypothetical protein
VTAWLIGIITFVLALFLLWRKRSRVFRERAECPKFRFLENLGIRPNEDQSKNQSTMSQENKDGQRNP